MVPFCIYEYEWKQIMSYFMIKDIIIVIILINQ
jgi:hypothetical protein